MDLSEIQYKDHNGKWQKLHQPTGVTIDPAAYAFDQCRSRGLVTRCVKMNMQGELEVTAGPFSVQKGPLKR